MKKILFALAVLFIGHNSFAQAGEIDELPAVSGANSAQFFIPASVIKQYELTEGNGDAWMKVYDNNTKNAKLQRVSDLRWQASSKVEALKWYTDNIGMISEGGDEVTDQLTKPIAVDAWHVYLPNERMKKMIDALGIKQNQYTFTFVVDKYVVKIFVGTNDATSLQESWKFAREGLKAVLKASGNPKMAELVL